MTPQAWYDYAARTLEREQRRTTTPQGVLEYWRNPDLMAILATLHSLQNAARLEKGLK